MYVYKSFGISFSIIKLQFLHYFSSLSFISAFLYDYIEFENTNVKTLLLLTLNEFSSNFNIEFDFPYPGGEIKQQT